MADTSREDGLPVGEGIGELCFQEDLPVRYEMAPKLEHLLQ